MVSLTLNGPRFDRPAEYRISFKGALPESWSDRLGGMAISIAERSEGAPITTLSGWLPDQAALLGVLNALYGMHLPLVSVEYVVGE